MERLTTDTPNGNFEIMLNFVYGKDGWAYIRHDGEHENVSLTDWAKRQCWAHGCDEALTETPDEIDQRLCDCMMDGPICPIAMAYCFASQAVHLRDRLKMYEDTGLGPAVSPPPNDPLTLEQLLEMDGEPVYVHWILNCERLYDCWAIVNREWQGVQTPNYGAAFFDRYGEFWIARRRKPEDTNYV